jgi:hypothetical protein
MNVHEWLLHRVPRRTAELHRVILILILELKIGIGRLLDIKLIALGYTSLLPH